MKPLRLVLLIILLLILGGGGYFLYQWNKPHRSAASEKGIMLSVPQLVSAYTQNEHAADSLYLNKTLEVSGTVAEWGKNDAGQATALFKSDDMMTSVFCTFKSGEAVNTQVPGAAITVKGFCSGLVGDVKLTDCVLKK